MGRNHLRRGVWALALLTCFALLGAQTAFAFDNRPRVHGGGFFNKPDFNAGSPSFADEIKFGVTGRCAKTSASPSSCTTPNVQGRFEYFNKFTGFRIHGKITSLSFQPAACAAFGAPNGKPAASIQGQCDDGATCTQFQVDVVDNDPTAADPTSGADWVCNVHVHAIDNKGRTEDTDDQGEPLNRGEFKIRNSQ